MSRPESVSSRIPSVGSSKAICNISLRFFSPPEKPSLTARYRNCSSIFTSFIFSRTSVRKSMASNSSRPMLAHGVHRRLQQIDVADAGNFDRILKREEDAGARALLGRQRQQILVLVYHFAVGDFIPFTARQHIGERGLA